MRSQKPALLLVIVLAILSAYSVWVEPNWFEVSIHDMRPNKDETAIRIVQLSDLHLQDITSRERNIVQRVKALRPDLVVFSGDVMDASDRLPSLHFFLENLGDTPAVAILGNWEYWAKVDLQALKAEYAHHGIPLLLNEPVSYRIRFRTLHLLGLDDFTAGHPESALLGEATPSGTTVLLQHSPGYFENVPPEIAARKFTLCLSGHTHGGQITLFGMPVWMPPGSGSFAAGFYETPHCNLYVSRGVGMSLMPARFGSRPEIAVFDL